MSNEEPYISKELVEFLEERFPDQVPDPSMTDRDIWMCAGSVKVVRLLRRIYTDQNPNVLRGNVDVF